MLTITLNRPDVLNSLNGALRDGLRGALDEATEPSVRAVVITGVGRAFCVGQDLGELRELRSDIGALLRDEYHALVLLIRALEKPVIAAVNGPAAGAGLSLACACDIRIASSDAIFIPAFVGIGLVPDSGGSFFIHDLLGFARAFELMGTGRTLSASEALEWGLVSEVVDPESFSVRVSELAGELAAGPTRAIGLTKQLFHRAATSTLEEQLEHEAELQNVSAQTDDFAEGLSAFLEKRKPEFHGEVSDRATAIDVDSTATKGAAMDASERGQVTTDAATTYEEFFVPALFAEWPDRVLGAARVAPGQRVLDVACGTGILARRAAERTGAGGQVVGLDVNEGMLAAAAAAEPSIEWVQGEAEHLPFDADSFDAVVSQFGLMFFDDQPAAIAEMGRVARLGAPVAVAVWAPLEVTPGYAKMAELLERLFGPEVANALRAPYSLGDKKLLASLFASAGLAAPEIDTHVGTARFDSIESWVHTDIRGWTLADVIDDDQYATLLAHARSELRAFADDDGQVRFDAPAHIAVSRGG